jgi:hypothetical protein
MALRETKSSDAEVETMSRRGVRANAGTESRIKHYSFEAPDVRVLVYSNELKFWRLVEAREQNAKSAKDRRIVLCKQENLATSLAHCHQSRLRDCLFDAGYQNYKSLFIYRFFGPTGWENVGTIGKVGQDARRKQCFP